MSKKMEAWQSPRFNLSVSFSIRNQYAFFVGGTPDENFIKRFCHFSEWFFRFPGCWYMGEMIF